MKTFDYNNLYLMKDGEPWFPVMGEMHYSRYREDLWEESLRKMKAGGVTVVSTYVIWIHHEEEKGVFEFSGCRDIGRFVRLCQKVGLMAFLRIGPWCHGEVRNGGFPDWIQNLEKEGVLLRSNDERYLKFVRRYWEQVYVQVKGMMFDEGGPVIGIQIENEYGHVGGLQGEEGEAHMRTLTAMAKEIGFRTPLYTATGWGGACIGDLLPVMGGYCEAPWDQSTEELPANTNYVFSHIRNDALIACDHHVEGAVTFDESKFPFLTAELGGGLQVTAHRRPVATGTDLGAMSLTKLGSGVALLGYYMYHGGSNPKGKFSTLQESRETGYLNDLPEINYDFNAPLRQYGTIAESYGELKLLAYFLQDFGSDIAVLQSEIMPENVKPNNMHVLRTACRHDDEHGYVFFNNYQRKHHMDRHENVVLKGLCGGEAVEFPAIDIEDGEYAFFPYRMKLDGAVLHSALATPLCRLKTANGNVCVFYGDREPKFVWETEAQANVLHISRENALHAFRVTLDQEYLVLSDDFVWEENGTLKVSGGRNTKIRCYPELSCDVEGFTACGWEREFCVYERIVSGKETDVTVLEISKEKEKSVYEMEISYPEMLDRRNGQDVLLYMEFAGERMEIFMNDEKINDYFYAGQEAVLSLGYFEFPKKLRVEVRTLHEDDAIFLEKWPIFSDGCACSLNGVQSEMRFR